MSASLFDLKGKVALVTGGNKGLGKAMARGLAEAGADIVISSRNREELQSAAQEISTATGRKCHIVPCDMQNREQVKALAADAVATLGRVDILVNNAGMNIVQPIDGITDDVWDQIIETNLTSVMSLTRALVPQMKERRWGRIVHISSMMAYVSKEKRNAYSATKAALIGMCHASALELGPFGITVNCIAPGPFLTDMPGKLLSAEEKAEWAKVTALGRWGDPKELVGPLLFIASDAGSYLTGQALVIDGGFTIR